jgi:negative regulator of sigma E activity
MKMRVVTLALLSLSSLLPAGAFAQDWNSLMATNHEARWNACYKETRLIHRTRNMSEEQYRVIIKDARRVHMQDCMARSMPPRPTAIPNIAEKKRPAQIAGWAANP